MVSLNRRNENVRDLHSYLPDAGARIWRKGKCASQPPEQTRVELYSYSLDVGADIWRKGKWCL